MHVHREGPHVVEMPYHRPRTILATLLAEEPWLLLGGLDPGPDAHTMLSTFWKAYKIQHPTHKIFTMGLDLSRTIPMMMHGDGARTTKKQPLEVVSLIAVMGLNTKEDVKCHCPQNFCYSNGFSMDDPMLQKLNNSHNSYLHHFLLFCFPAKRYKTTPGLLKSMLRLVSDDIADCCEQGVRVSGDPQPYHIGIIGLRGDAEWHSKTGILERSYRNVGHVNQIPCCHQCNPAQSMFLLKASVLMLPGRAQLEILSLGPRYHRLSRFSLSRGTVGQQRCSSGMTRSMSSDWGLQETFVQVPLFYFAIHLCTIRMGISEM